MLQTRKRGAQGRLKHFRTSERPRNSRERNWSKLKKSVRARSILICRNGRSPQRRCLNGLKNRMQPVVDNVANDWGRRDGAKTIHYIINPVDLVYIHTNSDFTSRL